LMEPAAIEPAPVADLPKERRRRSDACSQRRTDVTHREKVAYLLTDLGQRGLQPQHVAPPWYRLLWRFGIEVRPPHFAGFWWVLAVHGGLCAMVAVGVTWTIHRWTGVYQHWSNVIIDLAGIALLGVILGVSFAISYRRQARGLALPRWEDYPTA